MDLQPSSDGRWHFSLGIVEKWLVGFGVTALVSVVIFGGRYTVNKLDTLNDGVVELAKQQALTNYQLQIMNTQMADMPAVKLEVAKHAVLIDQNTQEIKELRQTKGLK